MALEQRMIEALKGLYLLSSAPASKLDPHPVSHSKDPSRPPSGEGDPLVDQFARRWAGAHRLDSRLACVKDAEETLRNAKRQPEPRDREFERGSLAWKRRIANDDRSPAEVARLYTVSRHQVAGFRRQYREEAAA